MKVVAEGVETREQLECLRRYGCPEGQGYYFSKAIDAADFTRLLRRGI
jgi:EAL domain-containing protein (putative c-di-GMP-specific phosphodiesterase class I)